MFAASKTAAVSNSGPNYIEDVFSTYLYTGSSGTVTNTNNIDISGKGGLVWVKNRSASTTPHMLADTARGGQYTLNTDTSSDQGNQGAYGFTFSSTGFSLPNSFPELNTSGNIYASWTFRKQPKFFDVVTYTGNGAARTIAHNLGGTVGSIFIKQTNAAGEDWAVYHRGLPLVAGSLNDNFLTLNTTSAYSTSTDIWNRTVPTSTVFSVGNHPSTNSNGATYVAYLFAHDAGGFGLTGTDNVISCGTFVQDTASGATVTLGYEPQFLLVKRTDSTSDWFMLDVMRGQPAVTGSDAVQRLASNLADAEVTTNIAYPTATGFYCDGAGVLVNGATYIYIAVRRGPMKVPTTGTSVFQPVAYTGTNVDNRLVDAGIVTDMTMARIRTATSTGGFYTADRLRANQFLGTAVTAAGSADANSFMTPTVGYGNSFSAMNGFGVGNDATRQLNQSSTSQLAYAFKRAPNVFDEVCYTGTGSSRTVAHNLCVVPEMMIIRRRNSSGMLWVTYAASQGNTKFAYLNSDQGFATDSYLSNTTPTSSVFTVGTNGDVNASGGTYVSYLFATCAGVSKVGSYTGTGTTLQVDCGFTGGARFVLIKRTDSTGDWYVWDSARGIVSGNDPYLLLNSTAAEVTSTDYVDTYSAGFEISSTAPAAINASGGTFIFLAIA